jgi:hypothetical protein
MWGRAIVSTGAARLTTRPAGGKPPRVNHRTRTHGLFAAALFALAVSACAGGQGQAEAPGNARDEERATALLDQARQAKDIEHYRRLVSRFPDTNAASDGRDELAGLLIQQAEKYLGEEDFSTADDRAEEATLYAGLENTRKARDVQKRVDEGRAARIKKKVEAAAGQGKCASALKLVAGPLREKPRPNFKRVLQEVTADALVRCVTAKTEEDVKSGNIDAARTFLASPDATTALDKASFEKASTSLNKVLVGRSLGAIQPLLDGVKWSEAFAQLEQMKKDGKLSDAEFPVAQSVVRDALKKHAIELAKSGITSKKPAEAAKKVAEEVKLAGFKEEPKELSTARHELAIAVECARLNCKLSEPRAEWAWGAIEIRPAESATGAESGKLEHAQKVWVLGKGGTALLIATEDPGAAEGAALYGKASGWVDGKNVKTTDTTLWLPPPDQLAGVRVWAPLRAPSKDYHLGTVKKVEGKKATVERMQDKAEIEVDLAAIRVGTLQKGLRVMAFCTDQVHTENAKVDSVVAEEAIPKVKYVCDKGDVSRVDIASALISKADWLPARKP